MLQPSSRAATASETCGPDCEMVDSLMPERSYDDAYYPQHDQSESLSDVQGNRTPEEQALLVAHLVALMRKRWAEAEGVPPSNTHGTYAVRVPAPGVPYVPRTVAAQVALHGLQPLDQIQIQPLGRLADATAAEQAHAASCLHVRPKWEAGASAASRDSDCLRRGQNNMTPEQQAVNVALSRIQLAQTEVEVCKVARTLAYALGTVRAEVGTIKALHAVLLQLLRPGMTAWSK